MDDEHRRHLLTIVVLLSLYIGIFVSQLLAADVYSIGFVFGTLFITTVVLRLAWWIAGLPAR